MIDRWPPTSSFFVKVKSNSKNNRVVCWDAVHNCFRIQITAAAIEGQANKELLKFLKKELGRPVIIRSGMSSKTKKIEFISISEGE